MALSPLRAELSPFEKIEIVRAEVKARAEEIAEVERRIRWILGEAARREFLGSIAEFYRQWRPPEEAKEIPGLEARRASLHELLGSLKALQAKLEAKGALPAGARPPSAAPRPISAPPAPPRGPSAGAGPEAARRGPAGGAAPGGK